MRIHERKMKFGSEGDGGLGDRLVRQVLDGTKTATCELKTFCTAQEVADLNAEPGWTETVIDAAARPRCNVRITSVYETTFGNPDPRLVRGEGCGEDSEEFKRGHGRWFNALLEEKGLPPLTDDSILVVWQFELIETA